MSLNTDPRRGLSKPKRPLSLRSREQAAQSGGKSPRRARSASEFRPPEFSPPTKQNDRPSLSEAAQRPETDPEKRKEKKDDRPHLTAGQKQAQDITETLYQNVADVAPRNAVGLALMRGVAGARLGSMVGEQIAKSKYESKQKEYQGGEGMSEAAQSGRTQASAPRRRRRRREPESA